MGTGDDGDTGGEAGMPFLLRRVLERGRRLWQALPAVLDLDGRVFDNWAGPLPTAYRQPFTTSGGQRLTWKGRAAPVPVTARTHVCTHITAVEFGTSARRRRVWRRRIDSGAIDDEVLERFGLDQLGADGVAERMALHERFWTVPYHWVGLRNGDILYNNDITRYTYHGNGANSYAIGVSAEADLPALERRRRPRHTDLDERFIETQRATLRTAVLRARRDGAPIEWVTAHRCYSASRAGDPGEGYWREVVRPVADELALRIDHDFSHGSGRPIPDDWDPDARYDYAGRLLPGP